MYYSPSCGGFYDITHSSPPDDAVEIGDDLHQRLLAAQSAGARIIAGTDGYPVAVWPAEPTQAETLAGAKTVAIQRMLLWITSFLSQFTAGVPDDEVKSWSRKAEAARAHLAGTPQPMILAEAAITGEDPKALAAKIAAKADAFELIMASVTGLRRATETAISAATTPEEVSKALTAAQETALSMAAKLGLPQPNSAEPAMQRGSDVQL